MRLTFGLTFEALVHYEVKIEAQRSQSSRFL